MAVWLLRRLAGRSDAPWMLGDAGEEFARVVESHGPRAARRWYWAQTLGSVRPLLESRLRRSHGRTPMDRRRHLPRVRVRHTLRAIRRSPGVSAIVIATLAVGIGMNTAVFSVIDAVLLRPLPYAEPDRLVAVWESSPRLPRSSVTPGDLAAFREDAPAFDDLAAYSPTTMTLTGEGPAEQFAGERVSWNLFALLGVPPALGRAFAPDDDREGAARVVILTDGLWRRRFGADRRVIGRTIVLNANGYQVVGVMPRHFRPMTATLEPAFFVPLALSDEAWRNRGDHTLLAVGRIRDGATVAGAQAALDRVLSALDRDLPDRGVRAHVAPLGSDVVRNVRPTLLVLIGAAALVVLMACANVASLLLAWSSGRRHETAVRIALGARRLDIAVEIALTSLALAIMGGAAGLALGVWTRDVLVALAPSSIPRLADVSLDGRVLLVAAALTIATGLASGIVPALQMARRHVAPGLRDEGRESSGSRAAVRWRGALLVVEVAAAVVLALGAGLLARSLWALNAVELGFDTERVLAMTVRLPQARYPDPAAYLRFFDAARERLAALPGVVSVAYANQFPLRGGWGGGLQVDGAHGPIKGEADLQTVSPEYFETLGIPLVRGRLLSRADRDGSPLVAVVSQTFASRWSEGRDPLTLTFRRGADDPAIQVVGIVGDVRRDGKFAEVVPQVYFAAAQTSLARVEWSAFAIRTAGDPTSVVDPARQVIAALDPDLAASNIRTLDEMVQASVASRRFNAWLLSAIGFVALLLASIGVYGVVSQVVAQRTREMGIRLAMGARRGQVIALVMRGSLGWVVAGLAVGLVSAALLSRLITSLLFEVSPGDPATFAGVGLLLLAVATIAGVVPARRAARGNPLTALR